MDKRLDGVAIPERKGTEPANNSADYFGMDPCDFIACSHGSFACGKFFKREGDHDLDIHDGANVSAGQDLLRVSFHDTAETSKLKLMKKMLGGCLVILTFGFALLYWSEKHEGEAREQRMLTALDEIKQEKEKIKNAAAQPLRGSLPTVPAISPGIMPHPLQPANKPLRRLMQDPEMRENLRQEAAAHAERMANDFVSRGLTNLFQMNEEQKGYMHDLLTNKFSVHWRFLDGAMAGEIRPDNVKEEAARVKAEMEMADSQIRNFLGDDNFKAYKDFERSQPDREKAGEIVKRLTAEGVTLTEDQSQRLGQTFTEERKNYPWRVNFEEDNGFDFEHFFANTSEARSDIYFQDMENLQARILTKAQEFLRPEQLSAFAEQQRKDLSRSKFVFRSTTALMNAAR
ncbi:MAG: hypothetical protein JWN25_3296 [Verrucomicrobiales bacterium]|nr:hypothetical protein [Verrucomicrobiales bacterium]